MSDQETRTYRELLKYFWPYPYPTSHPPINVSFNNGLPCSENDRIHKTFIVTYSVFTKAIYHYVTHRHREDLKELVNRMQLDMRLAFDAKQHDLSTFDGMLAYMDEWVDDELTKLEEAL